MIKGTCNIPDGCDIPKSAALQSCIFPVSKYLSVIHYFNHKYDALMNWPKSSYQFAVHSVALQPSVT